MNHGFLSTFETPVWHLATPNSCVAAELRHPCRKRLPSSCNWGNSDGDCQIQGFPARVVSVHGRNHKLLRALGTPMRVPFAPRMAIVPQPRPNSPETPCCDLLFHARSIQIQCGRLTVWERTSRVGDELLETAILLQEKLLTGVNTDN